MVGIQSAKLGFQSMRVGFRSAACLFRLAAAGCREIMGNLQSFGAGHRAAAVGIFSVLVGSASRSFGRLEAAVGDGALVRGLETTKRTRMVPAPSRCLAMSGRQSCLIQRTRHCTASSKTPHGNALADVLHLLATRWRRSTRSGVQFFARTRRTSSRRSRVDTSSRRQFRAAGQRPQHDVRMDPHDLGSGRDTTLGTHGGWTHPLRTASMRAKRVS